MSFWRSPAVLAVALGILAAFIYSLGLPGRFALDDFPALAGLEAFNGRPDLDQALLYLTSGNAGLFGRPLSLLTFLMQAGAWPGDPGAFKVVNIALHLFNGALLFVLLRLLLRHALQREADCLALAVAAIWLLHPMNASSVLYVVQRMTVLASTFLLAAMLAYVKARECLAGNQSARAFLWLAGVAACGVLSVLAKDIGVLLPVYLLVIESFALRGLPYSRVFRVAIAGVIVSGVLAAILVYPGLNALMGSYAHRSFSLSERLLTEPRVVLDYTIAIAIPGPGQYGLFFDNYAKSTSLVAPLATPVALVVLAATVWAAWWLRSRHAPVSMGLSWFLGGHLLESTFIPLELYFEHRNYLPMVGVLVVLVYTAEMMRQRLQRRARVLATTVLAVWSLLLAATLFSETWLWGRPLEQALVWAHQRPESRRALERAATVLVEAGRSAEAVEYLQRLHERYADDAGGALALYSLRCTDAAAPSVERSVLEARLRDGAFSTAVVNTFGGLADAMMRDKCKPIPASAIRELLQIALQNPRYVAHRRRMWVLMAQLYMAERQLDGARNSLVEAYRIEPRAEYAFQIAFLEASLSNKAEADAWLARGMTGADGTAVQRRAGKDRFDQALSGKALSRK